MKHGLILLWVGILLCAITVPVTAQPAETADGAFIAVLDFSTLRTKPVGVNCLLTVQGTLTFTGRLAGAASATTRALVMGECPAVETNPPGTFADIFQSELRFTGTIDGVTVSQLEIIYQGRTAVGGMITGQMRFVHGQADVLYVEGVVAQGGSYWFRTPSQSLCQICQTKLATNGNIAQAEAAMVAEYPVYHA